MQITTATRTVEIYMNNETGITYRNVKDGAAYGPVRNANRATAKAGSVGREILDAIDAAAAEAEVAAPAATVGATVTVNGRVGTVTEVYPTWAAVTWTTAEDGSDRPSYGFIRFPEATAPVAAPQARRRTLSERRRIARNARR